MRLDDEAERTLAQLRRTTGLSISEVLKRGLQAYAQRTSCEAEIRPYEVYRRLELGAGGWSVASGGEAKQAVKEAIRRKLGA